jgi:type 1 fimbriae regulatory protein FimB/type 1 fimbriae regulatory protein FimE
MHYTETSSQRVSAMSPTTIRKNISGNVTKRTFLTPSEVEKLIEGAKTGRYGKRDALIIQMLYRHGLRTKELVELRWEQVLFDRAILHVERVKHGTDSMQPINGDELRKLREFKRAAKTPWVFETERGDQMSTRNIRAIVARAAAHAGLRIEKVHAHMLRHACGWRLANGGYDTRAIQGYLGHRAIRYTVEYTQLAEDRFKNVGKLF